MQNDRAGEIIIISCNKIIPSEKVTDKNIEKLSESIKRYGLLQPIKVRPQKYGYYEIISGNRRFVAAKLAGLINVACIITDIDEKTSKKVSFIENYFCTKPDFIEESEKIKDLIINYKYTIDEISDMLCTDIFSIINKLKILHFSKENRIKIKFSGITYNQCIFLLKLENTEYFDSAIDTVIANKMNDEQTEKFVSKLLSSKRNTVVFKDVKIFTNTILHAVERMKSCGIDAECNQTDKDDKIEFFISIPKHKFSDVKSLR